MNIIDVFKSENIIKLANVNINNKQTNYVYIKAARDIINACFDISNKNYIELYKYIKNVFIDDINSKESIIFDPKEMLFDHIDDNTIYISILREYLVNNDLEKTSLIFSKFYYILYDLIEVYGIDEVKEKPSKVK